MGESVANDAGLQRPIAECTLYKDIEERFVLIYRNLSHILLRFRAEALSHAQASISPAVLLRWTNTVYLYILSLPTHAVV